MRYLIAAVFLMTSPLHAAEHDALLRATRVAVAKLEAINIARLPVKYATGKYLEDERQRALRAAARIEKYAAFLQKSRSLETTFLLINEIESMYGAMRDLWDGLSTTPVEPERLQDELTTWFADLSDASGSVHNELLRVEDGFLARLGDADTRLRTCK